MAIRFLTFIFHLVFNFVRDEKNCVLMKQEHFHTRTHFQKDSLKSLPETALYFEVWSKILCSLS